MATYGGTSLSEFINGSGLSDLISGLGGNDTLNGGGLNDTLDGGTGTDSMVGGDGDDLYIVDSTTDIVSETAGSKHDRIQASISIDLNNVAYDGIEHVTLTGSSALSATGDDAKNVLIGNTGANHIDGREDADTMIGGAGSDTYEVNDSDDSIVEIDGEGTDQVNSSAPSFVLADFVENLTLTGTADIDGTGNALGNKITGNSGANDLLGRVGNDTLTGNDGDDVLDGGDGADSLIGGKGSDQYIVDDPGDRISESGPSTDVDTVFSSISYVLGSTIENLVLEGGPIDGTGNALANQITGNTDSNVLSGLAGNDTLDGFPGADLLLGGDGNDTLVDNDGADTLVGGAGNDIFQFGGSTGGTIADFNGLPGGDLIDVSGLLTGVTAATASGFLDTKIVNGSTMLRIDEDGGADKFVDLALLEGVVTDLDGLIANAALLGIGALTATPLLGANGNDVLTGGTTSTLIQGLGGNDSLTGDDGFDTLDGGTGTDTLAGGDGGDTYILDSTKDVIVDTGGKDRILASFTIDLELAAYDGIEHATLTGTGALNASGDSDDNVLVGNTNANRLDGRTGADTLIGGVGNDIYTVDQSGDVVIENVGEGIDTVNSDADYTLSDNIEKLVMTGTGAIAGTGNALANTITGNNNASFLSGGDGNDTLTGNDGDDTLAGDAGADSMVGGRGNDTYRVDDTGDRVSDSGSATESDKVESTITYVLGTTIEKLALLGTDNIDGTGNALANDIVGNDGSNLLQGLSGNDTLDGGDGSDTLLGGDGNDSFVLQGDGDSVVGGNGNDTLLFIGNSGVGDSVLDFDALPGRDVLEMSSLLGSATVGTIDQFLKVETSGGTTSIQIDVDGKGGGSTFVDLVDLVGVSMDTDGLLANGALLGIGAIAVPPTAGANGNDTLTSGKTSTLMQGLGGNDSLTGGAGFDTLDGGTGTDTLTGGAGSDTYVVDSTKDVIVETSGNDDRISASITIDLNNGAYAGIEHVTLTGTGNLNATGDAAGNVLIGNSGINHLDGGIGNDLMAGRGGNDVYEVDDNNDQIIETTGEGTDEVHSSATDYALSDFVENLTLTGTLDSNGTGNDLANRITGNDGSNTLTGGAGNDTLTGNDGLDVLIGGEGADSMVGGLGGDVYSVDDAGDRVVEGSEAGAIDLVVSTIDYTLGANVENLLLDGIEGLRGTGNSLGNQLGGGFFDDTLSGLAGNDTIDGDNGDDLLLGGDGADTLLIGLGTGGTDTLVGGTGTDTFAIGAVGSSGDPVDVIADFNATVNGDLLDLSDILSGFDPSSSNINDYLQCVATSDGTKVRVDTDGAGSGETFVDVATLVGVSTDVTGLLNNGNLVLD